MNINGNAYMEFKLEKKTANILSIEQNVQSDQFIGIIRSSILCGKSQRK